MRARSIAVAGLVVLAGCSTQPRRQVGSAPATTTTTTPIPSPSTAVAPVTTPSISTSIGASTSTTTVTAAPTTASKPTAFVCPPAPARAAPRDDRSRYTLTVTIDPAASRATGTMSVRFTPDLTTDRVVLRLWPNSP